MVSNSTDLNELAVNPNNVTNSDVHNKGDNTPLKNDLPKQLSLDKWADSEFEWSGNVLASSFERLKAVMDDSCDPSILHLQAQFYRRNNVLHLAFDIKGEVWLTCQRCLQPVAIDLSDDYDLALLDDDSQIQLLEEEQDYLLLDETVQQVSGENLLPFKALIEDEILLKLPLAPKHEDCELAVEQVGDIPEVEQENPFAALAALKGKL